jgi:hypothetical protein
MTVLPVGFPVIKDIALNAVFLAKNTESNVLTDNFQYWKLDSV